MTRNEDNSSTNYSKMTRRGFLGLAGTTAVAGCSGVNDFLEGKPRTIDGTALQDAFAAELPTIAETTVIQIEQSRLEETTAAIREILATVPVPFDSQEIPNGAIRAELTGMYEQATAALEDAKNAPTPSESMARLRSARDRARAVAAAWEAIDSGLTRDEIQKSIPSIRDSIESFRERWQYIGDEPIRAVLAHGMIEELVASANRRTGNEGGPSHWHHENPMVIGEFAGTLARAQAAKSDAEYLYGQYESSLAHSRQIRSELVEVGETLVGRLEDRLESLPDGSSDEPSTLVGRDVEDSPATSALTNLYRGLQYRDNIETQRETGQRANVIRSAYETLVRVRAFELLQERIRNTEHTIVETADDVRLLRKSSITAINETASSISEPSLGWGVLSQVASGFEYTDGELREYDEDQVIEVDWIRRDLGRYVLYEVMTQAIPPVERESTATIQRVF